MIIDTHCHLDDDSYDDDFSDVLDRAKANGVEKIIIPGADINDLQKARNLAHANENVYFSVGVHPYHCNDFDLSILESYANDEKCVAVGECGLDYYRLKSDFENENERANHKKFQKDVHCVRLFFRGKEMKDGNELWQYNVQDDDVIIIMCSG